MIHCPEVLFSVFQATGNLDDAAEKEVTKAKRKRKKVQKMEGEVATKKAKKAKKAQKATKNV